jgi:hypothetical protein
MNITEILLDTAKADTDRLLANDRKGDVIDQRRNVHFLLIAPDKEKAMRVADFIDDNRYGQVSIENDHDKSCIYVGINMPIDQHIICCVSGLMACIAKTFEIEYGGWESKIQRAT